MTELTYVENVTATKCVECGDKLTDWETSGYCIICDPSDWEDPRLSDEVDEWN